MIKIKNEELQPYDLPFSCKPSVTLTKYYRSFKQFIEKKIVVNESDHLVLQHILNKLKTYQQEYQHKYSQLNIQRLKIHVVKLFKSYQFRILHPFIKGNTLNQYLNNNQRQIPISKQVIQELASCYVRTINLNHIICSSNNIFVCSQRKDKISLQFNYTSVGFILDLYNKKPIQRTDLIQYAAYLTPSLFRHELDKQFNYLLKLRSLAINLLSIILQREISFNAKYQVSEQYTWNQCQKIVGQNKQYFQIFINQSKIKSKINKVQNELNIDCMAFIRAIVLQQQEVITKQFGSWAKVIEYFKVEFLHPYSYIFQLQFQIERRAIFTNTSINPSYLLAHIAAMWQEQSQYLQNQFQSLGIISGQSKQQLIIYLLCKYNLILYPTYSLAQDYHHQEFTNVILRIYSQIIQQSKLSQQMAKKHQFLLSVIARINEGFTQKGRIPNLYYSRQKIDVNCFYQQLWHTKASNFH